MESSMLGKIVLSAAIVVAVNAGAGAAAGTPFGPGTDHQAEDHSFENHSSDVMDGFDLTDSTFEGSNLKDAFFVGGDLTRVILSGVNLSGGDLTNAILTNAVFSSGSNLKDTILVGATVFGLDLTGVNVSGADFTNALYNGTETLPFDPVAAGMILVPEATPASMLMLGLFGLWGYRRSGWATSPLSVVP
jgi:hypothetical protein